MSPHQSSFSFSQSQNTFTRNFAISCFSFFFFDVAPQGGERSQTKFFHKVLKGVDDAKSADPLPHSPIRGWPLADTIAVEVWGDNRH